MGRYVGGGIGVRTRTESDGRAGIYVDRGNVIRARCICAHGGSGGGGVDGWNGTERRVAPSPGGISERAVPKPNREAWLHKAAGLSSYVFFPLVSHTYIFLWLEL